MYGEIDTIHTPPYIVYPFREKKLAACGLIRIFHIPLHSQLVGWLRTPCRLTRTDSRFSAKLTLIINPLKIKRTAPKGIVGIKRTNSVGELAAYYSLSDVYFNPTWEDNFPTVNLEALACGTPVITYRTGGSVEAVDENTGFIVEQGDIISVTKIVQLIKEKGKGYWTSICRERATSLYDKRKKIFGVHTFV